ncbi:hypothetical protein GCM10010324_67720 [Streptomyces hiroshimensis]|uniref:Uncharacterized protein n=1 Tax=Streptomyces hiroshimensis TaxID=66424 RepID=A0ABQ2ZFF2_9ACTN|nr:hypothetical protein GCM10010324_67720 [Streptomyces hiroshimensis]
MSHRGSSTVDGRTDAPGLDTSEPDIGTWDGHAPDADRAGTLSVVTPDAALTGCLAGTMRLLTLHRAG